MHGYEEDPTETAPLRHCVRWCSRHRVGLHKSLWTEDQFGQTVAPAPMLDRNGYRVVDWNASGMSWWAVSDLNARELRQFENLYLQ